MSEANTPLHIGIAGTTLHTVICAESLLRSGLFVIDWVLTPAPKPVGRKQELTANPLAVWADQHQLPKIELQDTRITPELRENLEKHAPTTQKHPDLLLVVDFGYLVPQWLLEYPTIASLNIHPSLLPRWRGSSPGQFVLLAGETNSAITLMTMSLGLDEGDIIHQWPITVNPTWDTPSYYHNCFELVAQDLPTTIAQFAAAPDHITPQPSTSPTPIARRLTKADAFVSWAVLKGCMADSSPDFSAAELANTSPLLQEFVRQSNSWPTTIERATRAFAKWPWLWTEIATTKGAKRMQIRQAHLENGLVRLDLVQIEGQAAAQWQQVKNSLQ